MGKRSSHGLGSYFEEWMQIKISVPDLCFVSLHERDEGRYQQPISGSGNRLIIAPLSIGISEPMIR